MPPPSTADTTDTLLDPPDRALARAAEEACREQPTDLAGFRLWDLPPAYVQHVVATHDRRSVTETILDLIRSEARAVPDGRFALMARCGFSVAVRVAPRPG